jgi:hypothetical protein
MSSNSSDRIEPALSASDWAFPRVTLAVDGGSPYEMLGPEDFARNATDLPALIALANAALPDSDLRKIRHHWISWLREEADILKRGGAGAGALIAAEIADALESYLPPSRVP